jgi:hypothetical protein
MDRPMALRLFLSSGSASLGLSEPFMQNAIRVTYYAILLVFVASAILCLCGVTYIWFLPAAGTARLKDLPYLNVLFTSLIVEAIAVVFLFVKRGIKYLPDTETNKNEAETFRFMCDFVKRGTTVTIVSNRLSLLTQSPSFFKEVQEGALNGKQFEVITPKPVDEKVRTPLARAGVRFIITNEDFPPEARFTLVNADRAGGERLAIARGTHPDHEITIFDSNSGPHMIAMAKDIIRKSKHLAHAL